MIPFQEVPGYPNVVVEPRNPGMISSKVEWVPTRPPSPANQLTLTSKRFKACCQQWLLPQALITPLKAMALSPMPLDFNSSRRPFNKVVELWGWIQKGSVFSMIKIPRERIGRSNTSCLVGWFGSSRDVTSGRWSKMVILALTYVTYVAQKKFEKHRKINKLVNLDHFQELWG